ncbi:MAG TPA: NADH-quinone oxidoreductase subunit I [Desulfobacteria bacterium]|nr:NADH-quinone oxidoreductase subunit I [Desulfobacteria bacterium]
MFGKGLVKGLGITLDASFKKKLTEMYPEVKPDLPPRTRSSMALNVPKCIACGICQTSCPNKVITISSQKNENNKKVLTGYTMNTGRCLFCGLCTEACPTKALHTTTDFENAVYNKEDLIWDMIKK